MIIVKRGMIGCDVLFGLNPLHNIVHLLVGVVWLASSRNEQSARVVSAAIGAVYLLVGVGGLFIAGNSDLNLLNLNQPDNVLHLGSAVLGSGGAAGAVARVDAVLPEQVVEPLDLCLQPLVLVEHVGKLAQQQLLALGGQPGALLDPVEHLPSQLRE
jgi:Domain of unknown function (DUF4383)